MISKETVEQLRSYGLTYQDIGDTLGVSRQRIHQVITGYNSPAARRVSNNSMYYQGEELEIVNALRLINRRKAIKRGRIYNKEYARRYIVIVNGKRVKVIKKRPRPDDICELCNDRVMRLNYHHWDDDKPERGIWVCGGCHIFIHKGGERLYDKYLRMKEDINGDN